MIQQSAVELSYIMLVLSNMFHMVCNLERYLVSQPLWAGHILPNIWGLGLPKGQKWAKIEQKWSQKHQIVTFYPVTMY